MKWLRTRHTQPNGDETPEGEKNISRSMAVPPADDLVALLRADVLHSSLASPDDRGFENRFSRLDLVRIGAVAAFLGMILLGWLFYAGPWRPAMENMLVSLANRVMHTPTPSPTLQPPTLTVSTATWTPAATLRPSSTPTQTPPAVTQTPQASPTEETGCVDVLSITLQDVGKTLCVQGVVLRTEDRENGFLVVFGDLKGVLYWISYDVIWSQGKEGMCVQITGEIKQLGSAPVLIFGYGNLPQTCPTP